MNVSRCCRLLLLPAVLLAFALHAAGKPPVAPQDGVRTAKPAARTAKATFAGGCFWSMELAFDRMAGVLSTTVGYTGGTVANPSYEQVSAQRTGHAEAVEVVYDPAKVRYEQLVEYFWRNIDPTTRNRQFCDEGSSYRTAIFAHDEEQLRLALVSRSELQKRKRFREPIVTEVRMAGPFYPAEADHQDYYRKHPRAYRSYEAGCGRAQRLLKLWGRGEAH